MNAADIRAAEGLWNQLGTEARKIAKSELARRVRSTGWEATLRWLAVERPPATAKQEIASTFCTFLGTPLTRAERGQLSNYDLFTDNRRALALAEALHIYARTQTSIP